MKRSSGALLPIFSLPSNTGIGNFGKNAYKFIDLLKEAKQSYWQVLPLNPIDSSNSPYFSVSHFAGSYLFIDLDSLVNDGLIEYKDIENIDKENNKNFVNYNLIKSKIYETLKIAYQKFIKSNYNKFLLSIFKYRYDKYIKDYVDFISIKSIYNVQFTEWNNELKYYNKNSIKKFEIEHKDIINFNYFLQYLFINQWLKLKKYANSKGIKIIGDMPIYSSNDSSDVWANSKDYLLDENLNPIEIAGCPPDAFNNNGQVWGNPLYNYDYMKKNNYHYMKKKFSLMFKLYDVIRLDHFRGYESYYAIKSGSLDAKDGYWRKGPNIDLFNTLKNNIKTGSIIAEDLGYITDDVKKMLQETGFPGMRVLQFAFNHFDNPNNLYRPHNYIKNCVAYIGTHDNDTFMGWYNNLCIEDKSIFDNYVKEYIDKVIEEFKHPSAEQCSSLNCIEPVYNALQTIYYSKANLVITNIQDILGIGSEGRINTPSTLSDKNWSYRFTEEQLFNDKVKNVLKYLTINSNR